MMLQAKPRLAAPAALVVAALLASGGCGGDGADDAASTATTPATAEATTGPAPTAPGRASRLIEVVVRGGSVQGGGRHEVNLDEEVRLRVTSDVADEVHIHGYGRRFAVTAGEPAELGFVANLPGVFEVELENSHKRLLDLEVQP